MLVGLNSIVVAVFQSNVGVSAGKLLAKGELVAVTLFCRIIVTVFCCIVTYCINETVKPKMSLFLSVKYIVHLEFNISNCNTEFRSYY